MARHRWHIRQDADGLTLARHWPPRFDLQGAADLALPPAPVSLIRIAHQIRQDLWRTLRRVRGFSPVVVLVRRGRHLDVRAGGRAADPVPPTAEARIDSLLSDPTCKERWIRWAKQDRCK